MTKTVRRRPLALLLPLALVLGIAACGETQPSRFYLLSSLEAAEAGAAAGKADKPLAVGVGPITMPEYLDRPQMVTRTSPTKLSLAEFDRWGEPLTPLFGRVMAENLSVLLNSERVYQLPRRYGGALDYRVQIDVFRFDADQTGTVFLTARWTLYGDGGRRPSKIGKAAISESAGSATDKEALATAMSRAVARLSREIAREIDAGRG